MQTLQLLTFVNWKFKVTAEQLKQWQLLHMFIMPPQVHAENIPVNDHRGEQRSDKRCLCLQAAAKLYYLCYTCYIPHAHNTDTLSVLTNFPIFFSPLYTNSCLSPSTLITEKAAVT